MKKLLGQKYTQLASTIRVPMMKKIIIMGTVGTLLILVLSTIPWETFEIFGLYGGITIIIVPVLFGAVLVGGMLGWLISSRKSSKNKMPKKTQESSSEEKSTNDDKAGQKSSTAWMYGNIGMGTTVAGVIATVGLTWYFWEKLPIATFMAGVVALFLIIKGGTLGRWAGISIMILVIFAGPHFAKMMDVWYGHTEAVIEGKKPLIPAMAALPTATPVVDKTTVIVPPKGREVVQLASFDCLINSQNDSYKKNILRVEKAHEVEFISSGSEAVEILVWRYNRATNPRVLDCNQTAEVIREQKLF